jgi:predicted metal-dependent TIM-barrel fold hydrolase
MSHRYTLAEFPALIRCEGGLVDLFCKTGIDPKCVPEELAEDVTEINILVKRMQARFESLSTICGYDANEDA